MYSTVLVTAPDEQAALSLARILVKERLVACANMFPIRSIYRWEGEVCEESEYAMLLKSRRQDFGRIKDTIAKHHPYKVPCIVAYDIDRGHEPYLEWIGESTERGQDRE